MLNIKTGRLIEEFVPSYVVFDLETTGISPYTDKVVEIAAVKVEDRKVTGEFSRLVNPGCHISEAASAVNGIYDEMVEREPSFDKILPEFIDIIGDFILVGHNIHAFDMNFIYRDSEAFLGKFPDNDYIDTLLLSRKCMPEMAHHRKTEDRNLRRVLGMYRISGV